MIGFYIGLAFLIAIALLAGGSIMWILWTVFNEPTADGEEFWEEAAHEGDMGQVGDD